MSETHFIPFSRLTALERRRLLIATLLGGILLELVIVASALNSRLTAAQYSFALFYAAFAVPYTWLLYARIYPIAERHAALRWGIVFFNGAGTAFAAHTLPASLDSLFHSLIILAIPATVIIFGRWPAYLYALSAILASLFFQTSAHHVTWQALGHIVGLPFLSFAIIETVHYLGRAIEAQMRRLETVNRVSQKISATIEINAVISLVREAVQEALRADTYYVALLQGETLRLELFYDDGEFFTGQELPARGGVAGWVIENRRPLLLKNLPEDLKKMGIQVRIIGQPKTSLSWMGVPMIASNHLIGVIAVASYRRNLFSESDLEMLVNLATQAALVIDNAFHHADVERQSRLDSLTQIYNHGSFLNLLQAHARQAQERAAPLSLIMLDVDHFKQYNDTFGHLAGDQALLTVVQAIHDTVRASDIVGRWGGEEFILMLPEASGRQAVQVAQRIRQTLRLREIATADDRLIPAPTVSQGVAVLSEVAGHEKLIDLADRRLYQAKGRGRDQVEPEESAWEIPSPTSQTVTRAD
ncbi:MAG: sensor domain-containing diguanylate cyclase [Chloroflexi bacterium]|nr:sensor domain-containing diguanylate cyclase [Chloroflexota bacterium]